MQITVLKGGPSSEREVSLVSGTAVAAGLREAGHTVHESDISPKDLSGLDVPCDVIFPVLHGYFGESGELQEILEERGLPYVGSNSVASRLAIDKLATKRAWEAAGLPTPAYQVVSREEFALARPLAAGGGAPPAASGRANAERQLLRAPAVVKSLTGGSSIGVYVCKTDDDVATACQTLLAAEPTVLIEQFVAGTELTVGMLEDSPLPPIRIVPKNGFFDFEAKYKSAETEHRFDTGLPETVVVHLQGLVQQANAIVGARDLSRTDVMVDSQHKPYLLEINTMPGFTPKSLLPEAAAKTGVTFVQLVDRLAKRAAARKT